MEKQLTSDARGHQLTNINVWTPDSRWLVYDVRPHGGSFSGSTIERVNVASGETQVLSSPILCAMRPSRSMRWISPHPTHPARCAAARTFTSSARTVHVSVLPI